MRYLLLAIFAACTAVPDDHSVYVVDLTPTASYGPCEGWHDVTLVYDLSGPEPALVIQNPWECELVDDLVACTLRIQGDAQRLWIGVNFEAEVGYLDYDGGYCRVWYDATITVLRDLPPAPVERAATLTDRGSGSSVTFLLTTAH